MILEEAELRDFRDIFIELVYSEKLLQWTEINLCCAGINLFYRKSSFSFRLLESEFASPRWIRGGETPKEILTVVLKRGSLIHGMTF